MATIKEVILKHHKKSDGTYNIKYRLTHNRQTAYINSIHFVIDKQLKKDLSLKDTFLLAAVSSDLTKYRKKISALGPTLCMLDIKELLLILTKDENNDQIDFIQFGHNHIHKLQRQGRTGSANNLKTVLNSLCDYFKGTTVDITKINSIMLPEYERYLRSEREISRFDQFKRTVTYKTKAMSDAGVHNHMRDLRILFNAARENYNDEDRGIIKITHYPFRKYKIVDTPMTAKKARTIEEVTSIRDFTCPPNSRSELARDMFMLSFYLCGMNSIDIYKYNWTIGSRVEYCRSKTTGRRKDRAFISIKLIPEARTIISKHLSSIRERYSDAKNFNKAINNGLAQIGKALNYKSLTHYDARHTVGTWARNFCRFSKDDVALALNHIDQTRKATDVYIAPDWKIVDEVQKGVVDLIRPGRGNNSKITTLKPDIARKTMKIVAK